MAQLRHDYQEYEQRGLKLLGVVGQAPKAVRAYLDQNPLPFPLLIDPQREVIKAYGVYNPLALDAWRIAHPTTILIYREGVIRWVSRGSSQFDRPSHEAIVAAIGGLGPGS